MVCVALYMQQYPENVSRPELKILMLQERRDRVRRSSEDPVPLSGKEVEGVLQQPQEGEVPRDSLLMLSVTVAVENTVHQTHDCDCSHLYVAVC